MIETDISGIAGVDEAGRGPLAGPVVAAAVILDAACRPAGLADSKALRPAYRERLARELRSGPHCIGIGLASRDEIDSMNILQATMIAMQRAVAALARRPRAIVVDGNRAPPFVHGGRECRSRCVVGGDASVEAISAASIIAKVHRDRLMLAIDREFPLYGFARHKGYPTAEHREKLLRYGPCREHRLSFAPVREAGQREQAP